MKIDWKLVVPIISLLFLSITLGYFKFSQDPPKIANFLTGQKPGVIQLEAPRQVGVNVPFKVNVIVDSQKQNVNAVGFYLRYNPEQLELTDFDTSESFCQFYPEKSYENSTGIMSLACGSPHPGFSGKNTLISLTFLPKTVAEASIQVDPSSQILLSDGKGTNILQDYPQTKISILNRI